MGRRRLRALLLGAAGAAAVFGVLFALVGGGKLLDALAAADPRYVLATLVLGVCWLALWSLMFRAVLSTLGVSLPVWRAFLVYSGAVFANNVTPFGQAGGEPVAALLVSKVTDERYETGLAGIATVDVLNVVPSVSLLLVGVGAYATTTTVGQRLWTAVATGLGIVVGVGAIIGVAWYRRQSILDRVTAPVARLVGRVTGGRVDDLEANLRERAGNFFEHVERVGTSRRRLAVVLGLSLSGWLVQVVALYVAFLAVGYAVSIPVLLFAIPLGNIAGSAPLPGGLGGIEATFVAVLVPATGITAPVVTAAVLVFRGVIYWLPVVVGGTTVTGYGVRVLS